MNQLPWEKEKRNIITKKEHTTNPNWGKLPSERTIEEHIENGVINLNKNAGPTSHIVANWAKKILHVEKAGHGGTLDPNVTGCLIIAIGNSTKILRTMLEGGKEYVCMMHIHKPAKESEIRKVMGSFLGTISQMPPKKSNVKRVLRTRTVYYIEIIEIKEQDVLFRVGCAAGTYIRTLCMDIGKKLKTGAHMQQLVRTKSGTFNDKEKLVTLQDLTDAYDFWKNDNNEKFLRYCIQPVEKAVEHIKKIWVGDASVAAICSGAKLAVPGVSKLHDNINKGDLVAIMSLKEELVALGRAEMTSSEIMKNSKGIATSIERVVMPQHVYPKLWKNKNKPL
ncbi:MAG: RNA-guided pseudouridylation complex pseudouridine synthase subunit Cbf5 [Candidatus Nanoarchaeia archaeon]|nr:RNA-guided pseudouridylation complex pseudouridine synthase subunit Cbf5 [Candidatus Nanoarchaeia archaeon]